ncbi:hypothetical protein HK405_005912 [Cladochytrium tenue]|nr:hypothetical protein HK405_005912 [Cladochytrium tenue]
MPNVDQWLAYVALLMTVVLLAFAVFRVIQARSLLNCVSLSAAACITFKAAAQVYYNHVLWVNCSVRFLLTLLFLVIAKLQLYVLHERRLSVFFVGRRDQRLVGLAFRGALYVLLVGYAADVAAQVALSCINCTTSNVGNTVLTVPVVSDIKISVYVLEMVIGLTLLAGNVYALRGMIISNQAAGIKSSTSYGIIIGSDAVRFLAVLPVEVYKLIFNKDSNAGIFPYGAGNGNGGFAQILDAYKVAILLVLLHFPSTYAQIAAKRARTGSSGGSGSKSANSALSKARAGSFTQKASVRKFLPPFVRFEVCFYSYSVLG